MTKENEQLEKEIITEGGPVEEQLTALRNLHDSDMLDLIAWMAVRVKVQKRTARDYMYVYVHDGDIQHITSAEDVLKRFKIDSLKSKQ